jgi:hypothetical protein
MEILGLAIFAVVLGAAGSEFLHAARPDLVKKVEDFAKRLVASFEKQSSGENTSNEE